MVLDPKSFHSPLRLGQHWQNKPAIQHEAPASQALAIDASSGPFPWFRPEDELLPFDADCFEER